MNNTGGILISICSIYISNTVKLWKKSAFFTNLPGQIK